MGKSRWTKDQIRAMQELRRSGAAGIHADQNKKHVRKEKYPPNYEKE